MFLLVHSTQLIRVRVASVKNATMRIERLSSLMASSPIRSTLEQATSIIAMAALSNVTGPALPTGGRTSNATVVLLGKLLSQLSSLPSVYANDLMTLPAAATAAEAIASITTYSALVLDDRYAALQTLDR